MGIVTFLFGDYPWNKGRFDKIKRRSNWDDIVNDLM